MRWEYKNIWLKGTGFRNLMDLDEIDEVMNSLGAQGWELASTINKGQNLAHAIAIFKRALSDDGSTAKSPNP